jgi:hypothetical protein
VETGDVIHERQSTEGGQRAGETDNEHRLAAQVVVDAREEEDLQYDTVSTSTSRKENS